MKGLAVILGVQLETNVVVKLRQSEQPYLEQQSSLPHSGVYERRMTKAHTSHGVHPPSTGIIRTQPSFRVRRPSDQRGT